MSNGLYKIIKLSSCLGCPCLCHPDYSNINTQSLAIRCGKLNKKIKIEKCVNDFPKWCPLENYKE